MACDHPIRGVWYISYRRGGSVVMNVFRRKDLAIGATRRLRDAGRGNSHDAGSNLRVAVLS
jgi:hypothetical protein